jgi:hypothetical protein
VEADTARKAAAKKNSNHSSALHRLSAAGGSSHALSRVSGCRSRSAAQIFEPTMVNLLLHEDDLPTAKIKCHGSGMISLRKSRLRFGSAGIRNSDVFYMWAGCMGGAISSRFVVPNRAQTDISFCRRKFRARLCFTFLLLEQWSVARK